MQNYVGVMVLWFLCALATIGAAVLAHRSWQARYVGRVAVGLLFVFGGALVHVSNLVAGSDYSGFANPSYFAWVARAWETVVVPNHVLFIGLLAAFEAVVGVLAVCGGRWTWLAYQGVLGFYLLLWLFGWMETVWVLVMLPMMLLLSRAEWRAGTGGHAKRHRVGVGA